MAGPRAALSGIGGSFDMPAGGQEITAVPLGPSGLVVPRGAPVRVVIGGAITRQPTPGLLFFCSTPEWNWACTSFWSDLVSADPIPPAGIFGFYARAFASWDGATPGTMDGDNDLTFAGPAGGEVYAGRAGWQCFYELNVKNPDGTLKYPYDFGPCHTFGGGYNVSVQPNDGGGALIVTASPSQLPTGGGSVTFTAQAADGSALGDMTWSYVLDVTSPPPSATMAGLRTAAPDAGLAAAREALARGDVLVPGQGGRLVRGRPEGGGIFFVIGKGVSAEPVRMGRQQHHDASLLSGGASAVGSSASSCGGLVTCIQQITASGTMLVQATVFGRALSAAAHVEVSAGGGSGGAPPKPPAVRIRKETDGLTAPQGLGTDFVRLEVAVVDSNGTPISSRAVTLTLEAKEGTAGHAHTGGKPPGSFDGIPQVTVVTGSDGLAYTVYVAPLPAGPVVVKGASDGADSGSMTIEVGVDGLLEFTGGPGTRLIGDLPEHPSNHWCTPGVASAIRSLGEHFVEEYGESIGINDMSLVQGGVFDLGRNWRPRHDEHRLGLNVDLRTNDRTDRQLRFIQRTWELLGGSVHDETDTDRPHYHLRF